MTILNDTVTTLASSIPVKQGMSGLAGPLGFLSKLGLKHPIYLLAAIPVIVFLIWYMLRSGRLDRKKMIFLTVRFAIVALIAIALAGLVWIETSKTIQDMPPITVLVDSSGSMGLFNNSRALGQQIYGDIRGMVGNVTGKSDKVTLEYFSEGNKTTLGDTLYYSMLKSEGQSNILVLLSDGNNNYGRNPLDVAKALSETNATIYAIKPGAPGKDVYIKDVIGESKIPSNSEYQLLIVVGNTGFMEVNYDLSVYVDNVKKFSKKMTQNKIEQTTELELRFEETGVHELKVTLNPTSAQDSIASNNIYYKTLEVVEKPRILVITNSTSTPLLSVLKRLYDVDTTKNPNADYNSYTSVVLDDIPASQLDRNTVNKLKQYVLNGNGLAVVGGKHSYEYGGYNSSFIENILPVMSTDKPRDRRKEITVLFMVDLSNTQAQRLAKGQQLDEISKAVIINVMRKLAENDSVGVIAFDTLPHEVSTMSPLGPKRQALEERVLSLQAAEKVGGTNPITSLDVAMNWLKPYTNDKYIVFISDGEFSGSLLAGIISRGEAFKKDNTKVYSVGIGIDPKLAYNFLEPLATKSGGVYYSLEQNERLSLEFGDNRKEDEGETFRLNIRDGSHFITRGLNLDSVSIRGYDKVYEKSASQLLITTRGGQPVLTVWHFGLGRVASLTTDDGDTWSTGLYSAFNGKLVSSTMNWVIGDLEKGKKVSIKDADISLGDSEDIGVKASTAPALTIKEVATGTPSSISLFRTASDHYSGTFTPAGTGFYGLRATAGGDQDLSAIAVNFPKEYSQLGLNEGMLQDIAGVTDGKVYEAGDLKQLEQDLIDHAKKISTENVISEHVLWPYFAIAALLLYFADVVGRRLIAILKRSDE